MALWLIWTASASAGTVATSAPAHGRLRTLDGIHAVAGGWRIDLSTRAFADTALLGEIQGYVEGPDGWVFVDALGVVARSATFLGPLERVGQLEDALVEVRGEGRLTVRDGAGRVWWTTGGPPAELGIRDAGPVLEAEFVDPSTGAAITQGGALWTTADGGASWQAVELSDAAERLSRQDEGLVAMLVGRGRHLVVVDPRPFVPEVPEELVQAVYATQLARHPWGAVDRITLPGGDPVLVGRDLEGTFASGLAADGSTERLGVISLEECPSLEAWGDRLVAVCQTSPEGGDYEARVSDDGRQWSVLATITDRQGLDLSDDGRTAALRSPCESGADAAGVCATTDGGVTWRTVPTEIVSGRALHGSRLVGSSTLEPAPLGGWRTVDLATGEGASLVAAEAPPEAVVRSAGFLGDDLAVTLAVGEVLWFVTGPPEALAVRPAPEGATQVAAARPDLVVAAGPDGSRLWWSSNRGRSWRSLRVELDGDPAALPVDELSCTDRGCRVGRHLVVGAVDRAQVLGPSAPIRPLRTWQEGLFPEGLPEITCVSGEPRTPRLPPAPPGAVRHVARGGDGEVVVDVVTEGEEVVATVRWVDPDGGKHAALPLRTRPKVAEGPFGVRASTAEAVLLDQRLGSWWAVDGRAVEPTAPRSTRSGVFGTDEEGSLWVTMDHRSSHGEASKQVVVTSVVLPLDGSEARKVSRVLERATSPFEPLVGWVGGPVLARPLGTDVWPVELLRLDRLERSVLGDPSPIRTCVPGETPRHFVYVQARVSHRAFGAETLDHGGYARLEPSGVEACLREVRVDAGGHEGWRLVASASGPGQLSGFDAEGRAVVCELRPSAP